MEIHRDLESGAISPSNNVQITAGIRLEDRDTNERKIMIDREVVIGPINTANPVQRIHGSHGMNNATPRPSS